MNKNKAILLALAISFGELISIPAKAAEFTPPATVAFLQVGFVVDRMLVFHNLPTLTNPNNCPIVTNGYIISETDPDRKTSYDMLIAAKTFTRSVQLVIDGCFQGRPRIVSVVLR
jgi:hypothetical protein